jgi:hypothetical protein
MAIEHQVRDELTRTEPVAATDNVQLGKPGENQLDQAHRANTRVVIERSSVRSRPLVVGQSMPVPRRSCAGAKDS